MKKIVGMIAAAALAATAFAEINIGSWNRAIFAPVWYDGDTVRSTEGVSWEMGLGGVRTGLGFSASTENAGFVMDIHQNANYGFGLGDNGYAWVKPAEVLRVAIGKIDNNWGRLDHCFGTWDFIRFGNGVTRGEGLAGIERKKGYGANFTLTPVEGLVIDYEANFGGDTNHTYDVMWENSSTMIGYQADFGFIRAIINGEQADTYKAKDTDTKPAASIAVAADITAVENLTLKVGAKIPTILTKESSAIKAAVAADYALDVAAIHAQVGLDVLPKKTNDDGDYELGNIGLNIGAGVDYNINDAFAVVADVRYQTYSTTNAADKKDIKLEDPAFGVYVGLKEKLSNATFDFGVQLGKHVGFTAANKADEVIFAVPLTITASF